MWYTRADDDDNDDYGDDSPIKLPTAALLRWRSSANGIVTLAPEV